MHQSRWSTLQEQSSSHEVKVAHAPKSRREVVATHKDKIVESPSPTYYFKWQVHTFHVKNTQCLCVKFYIIYKSLHRNASKSIPTPIKKQSSSTPHCVLLYRCLNKHLRTMNYATQWLHLEYRVWLFSKAFNYKFATKFHFSCSHASVPLQSLLSFINFTWDWSLKES